MHLYPVLRWDSGATSIEVKWRVFICHKRGFATREDEIYFALFESSIYTYSRFHEFWDTVPGFQDILLSLIPGLKWSSALLNWFEFGLCLRAYERDQASLLAQQFPDGIGTFLFSPSV